MRPEIQALIGNNGGLPVAADAADITDPKSQELIEAFNAIIDDGRPGVLPRLARADFYDVLVAELQELVNGTKTPAEVQQSLGDEYESYAADFR